MSLGTADAEYPGCRICEKDGATNTKLSPGMVLYNKACLQETTPGLQGVVDGVLKFDASFEFTGLPENVPPEIGYVETPIGTTGTTMGAYRIKGIGSFLIWNKQFGTGTGDFVIVSEFRASQKAGTSLTFELYSAAFDSSIPSLTIGLDGPAVAAGGPPANFIAGLDWGPAATLGPSVVKKLVWQTLKIIRKNGFLRVYVDGVETDHSNGFADGIPLAQDGIDAVEITHGFGWRPFWNDLLVKSLVEAPISDRENGRADLDGRAMVTDRQNFQCAAIPKTVGIDEYAVRRLTGQLPADPRLPILVNYSRLNCSISGDWAESRIAQSGL
jgi:hypothetical protein